MAFLGVEIVDILKTAFRLIQSTSYTRQIEQRWDRPDALQLMDWSNFSFLRNEKLL